jgi:hypothetical protein
MVKAQAEQTQTAAADVAAEVGFTDTMEEPAETMEETAVQAVLVQVVAVGLGLSLRVAQEQAAATVMPQYFIKKEINNMALLEKSTNNYYKIDFDRSAVRGLKVFVNYNIYKDTSEREKEKERQGKWTEFFQKLREKIQSQYDTLMQSISNEGLETEQVLCESEEGMIDSAKYPNLRELQNKLLELQPFEQMIGDRLFKYKDIEKETLVIPDDVREEIEALGFQREWTDSPILLDGGGEVYTGDYYGEPITYEFFYERLKTVMGETENC